MTTMFPTLRRLAQDAGRLEPLLQPERCDLCAEPVPAEHRHLLEVPSRAVHCACQACAILFAKREASLGKYQLIPDGRVWLENLHITEAQWDNLHVPVGLAFLYVGTETQAPVMAYPSPMGAVESPMDPAIWQAWAAGHPGLNGLAPDVEALLINRARGARLYFVVPIDDCFRLVALIGRYWKGLSGGQQVWVEIEGFFHRLKQRSKSLRAESSLTGQKEQP